MDHGNNSLCPNFFLTKLTRFPQQTYKISPANLNFLRVRGSFLRAVLVRSYALCYPASLTTFHSSSLPKDFCLLKLCFLSQVEEGLKTVKNLLANLSKEKKELFDNDGEKISLQISGIKLPRVNDSQIIKM